MNVSRFFRNLFRRKQNSQEPSVRDPLWDRLPHVSLPRVRLPDVPHVSLPTIRLPYLPPIHLPTIRLPYLPAAKIPVPSFANPFANFALILEERQRFFVILNWLGYVLVLASLLDYIIILYPLQLTDPRWELRTMTNLVNNAWFFLLGLILVYLPTRINIRRIELDFLSFLRFTVFTIGALSILLIPLGVLNTQRIHTDNIAQINREQLVEQNQLDILQEALETRQLFPSQLGQIGQALGVENLFNSQNPKETLLREIKARHQQAEEEADLQKKNRFRQLMTQSVRTHFGAFLTAVCLLRLWWEARWVKVVKDYIKEEESE